MASGIKALVFDLDGTLLDQEGAERSALEKLFNEEVKLDPMPPFSAFVREWRRVAEDYLENYLNGRMSFEEQRERRLVDLYSHFGKEIPRPEASRINDVYVTIYRTQWRAFEDALPLLKTLSAKMPLGIITNGDGLMQRAKIEATGIQGYFKSIVISGEAGCRKPEKVIFDKSAMALGLAGRDLAYVGDRLQTDAHGARDAGWQGIWINRKGMPGEAGDGGIKIIKSLEELAAF
jgi:putative hydrolase of the HAD superfamily